MSPPRSIKEVQKLVERLAALNRFISRSADKGLLFFKILRGVAKFEWNKTSQEAFDILKRYLVSPPLLTKPMTCETLYLYMAVSESAVSSVVVWQEKREHHPVYYVSKVLQGAEPRYSQIEKLDLSLVTTARKLRSLLPISPSDHFDEPSFETSVGKPGAFWKDGQVSGGVG
ncbi:UNVERIFIED_CONTAM: hypothetical protein Slati_4190600 [Sesamum latifolium]|uniref:Reverse transcriptase/retrotransposon-derived protein RNase H-like domain-containing protein n=1 Tax=Sesamum latifolium TaxID=2727402 RepID=A0AAW2TAU1_9LAMI